MSTLRKPFSLKKRTSKKDVRRFEDAPWLALFTIVITKDIVDPIPLITILVDFFTAPYIFYFLFRYTKKEERLIGSTVTMLELIPFLGILPMETGAFFIIYKIMERKRDRAKNEEEKGEE